MLYGDITEDILQLVRDNFSIDRIFDEGEIIDYINYNFTPEEVYSDEELSNWALSNGYVKQ